MKAGPFRLPGDFGSLLPGLLLCGAVTLAAIAVEVDADAIVVGRSASRFPRSVLGSVAAHLTRHAERPVLVVP